MSCEIKLLSKVSDLKQVQELFGFPQDDNWLNAVHYALSPTIELLVIAHGTQVVFLTSRWDNDTQHSRYTITWKGDLVNANDIITATVCLPIVGPEWTCIAFGLSSGVVQFYTDSGLEIYAQQWHNEPVQSIRAQSGKRKNEEIHIYYLTCVCIIQGSHLLQMLRSMKNHLQKAASSFKTEQTPLQEALPCRKWSYGGKTMAINDAIVVGPQKISTFDHWLTASMEGGFYARYKSAPPLNALVIAVGQKPYAGFHWAKEGFMQPVLADVARAVASKIKSALP